MNHFKEEIENRFKQRKEKRINTWPNFLIRVLILLFLILFIKQIINSDGDIFHSFKNLTNVKSGTSAEQEESRLNNE